MERKYEFKNGTIVVTSSKTCDQEKLKKATEEFIKKVMHGGYKNGNTNSTRNLNKK